MHKVLTKLLLMYTGDQGFFEFVFATARCRCKVKITHSCSSWLNRIVSKLLSEFELSLRNYYDQTVLAKK